MSFRREVSPLTTMCLKMISKAKLFKVEESDIARIFRHFDSESETTLRGRQQLVKALVSAGRLRDDSLPSIFFQGRFTSLSLSGAKFTSAYLGGKLESLGRALARLDLSGCFHLTDAAIADVMRHCPKLESLNISNMRKLTDASLAFVGDAQQQLTSLSCGGNFNFTGEGLLQFLRSARCHASLTDLQISGLEVADEALGLLVSRFGGLRVLGIAYCRASEGALSEHLPRMANLVELNLAWSANVTDGVIKAVGRHDSRLKELSVCGCGDVSASGIDTFLRQIGSDAADAVEETAANWDADFEHLNARFTLLVAQQAEQFMATFPGVKIVT